MGGGSESVGCGRSYGYYNSEEGEYSVFSLLRVVSWFPFLLVCLWDDEEGKEIKERQLNQHRWIAFEKEKIPTAFRVDGLFSITLILNKNHKVLLH